MLNSIKWPMCWVLVSLMACITLLFVKQVDEVVSLGDLLKTCSYRESIFCVSVVENAEELSKILDNSN